MHLKYLLFVNIVLFCHQPGAKARNEPVCSKFDYEEKLLEKMIRMEIKMEQMVNEIKKTKEDITTISNDVIKKVEKAEHDSHKFHRNVNNTLSKFSENFEHEKAKLTALAEKAFIPNIAFHARLSATVNLGANVKIVFGTVLMNEGDGYDKTSGIFSISQDGLYYFSVHLCNYGNKAVHYKIVKDNDVIALSTLRDTDNVFTCNSVSTVTMLKKGERVWVQTTSSSHIYTNNYRWNTFLGVLLHR